ncbi:MAG: cell division protein ZapA [Pyrinomonadaceae bacterium]
MSETVRVNIFDQIYSLRSPSGGAHVERMAKIVDERMRQISSHTTTFDLARIAVLAALNIADELERLKTHQYEQELESPAPPSADVSSETETAHAGNETNKGEAGAGGQSWFEAIFDAEVPVKNRTERLSSQISAKLQSLRQDESKPLNITDEEDN